MNAPDFQTEAHNLELAQRDAQLQELQGELANLQRQVYIAARSASILTKMTPIHQLDYQGLVAQLQTLASRPAEPAPAAAPAPEKNLVRLNDIELEIAAKGAHLIVQATQDEAKQRFKKMDVRTASQMMDVAGQAKQLVARLRTEGKDRGISLEDTKIQVETLSLHEGMEVLSAIAGVAAAAAAARGKK